MEKQFEEVTERKLTYLVSSDGEYRQYVRDLDTESEEYKTKVKRIEEYEASLECLLTSEVNAIPHVEYSCDDYQGAAFSLDATHCCEDRIYIFHIRSVKDIETVFKWLKVVTGEVPSIGKRLCMQKFDFDGKPREECRWFLTRYADEKGKRYNEQFDPEYFVDKDVVVTKNCDSEWACIEGTVEDIEASRAEMHKKVLDELKAQLKK